MSLTCRRLYAFNIVFIISTILKTSDQIRVCRGAVSTAPKLIRGANLNPQRNFSAISFHRYNEICSYNTTDVIGNDKGLSTSYSRVAMDCKGVMSRIRQWADEASCKDRRCRMCKSSAVVQGVASDDDNCEWIAYFCKNCAPHLSVRRNAKVPVASLLGLEASTGGGESARLFMLPLYKRCHACRRFATYGAGGGAARRETHCKKHRAPGDVDVVHRRRCQHTEGCGLRPCFAAAGAAGPLFCGRHRLPEHVDVVHSRCDWKPPNPPSSSVTPKPRACWRRPRFGSPEDSQPRRCLLHRDTRQSRDFFDHPPRDSDHQSRDLDDQSRDLDRSCSPPGDTSAAPAAPPAGSVSAEWEDT